MKKLALMLIMVVTMLCCAAQGFAENGAPIYNHAIDEKTSYGDANDVNIALVKMVKPNYTEEYEIQFFKDYFVVVWVTADDASRRQALQAEVGLKQEYGPNPRVNAVKNGLENEDLFQQPLANRYVKPAYIADENAARALLTKAVMHTRPDLGSNWQAKLLRHYRPEYHGSHYTYVYKATSEGRDFAEYTIDAGGWVEYDIPGKNGTFFMDKLFRYSADGQLIRMVANKDGIYFPEF